jgi:hypothetical protein
MRTVEQRSLSPGQPVGNQPCRQMPGPAGVCRTRFRHLCRHFGAYFDHGHCSHSRVRDVVAGRRGDRRARPRPEPIVVSLLQLRNRGRRLIGRLGFVAQPRGGQLDRQAAACGLRGDAHVATATANSARARSAGKRGRREARAVQAARARRHPRGQRARRGLTTAALTRRRPPPPDSVPSSQRHGTAWPVRCTPPVQRSTPLSATGFRELRSHGNATRCCGPCSSALGPPDRADRGDRAQVLDQHPVDGESALA